METKQTRRPKGWIRWKGFIAAAVLALGWFLVTTVFMDKWLEWGVEKAGEEALGAKVEIDGFDLKLSDLSVRWTRLQAADPRRPMRNILETGRNSFRMNPSALLRKRVVIEEMTLEGVRSGTARRTDGSLARKPKLARKIRSDFIDRVRADIRKDVESLPKMNFDPALFRRRLNVDSLIALSGIRSVHRIDSVRKEGIAAAAGWAAFQKSFRPDVELQRIRDDFQSLDPQSIQTVREGLALVDRANSARKSLSAIADTFEVRQKAIRADIRRFSAVPDQVAGWVQEDYRTLADQAKLPDLSFRAIAKKLIGGTLASASDFVLGAYEGLLARLPRKAKPEKESRPRFRGQDILFEDRHQAPAFLIRRMRLSGRVEPGSAYTDVGLSGTAENITNQPWITGKPMTVDITARASDGRTAVMNGVLDRVTEAASDQFRIRLSGFGLDNVRIVNSEYLPSVIRKGQADIDLTLRFRENDFSARLNADASGVVFDSLARASSDLFAGVVQSVIGKLDRITLDVAADRNASGFRFGVDSNIDEVASRELRSLGARAVADAEARIRSKLYKIRDEKLAEFEASVGTQYKAVGELLDGYEKWIREDRSLLDGKIEALKKEIEKRKKSEENKLKDRAKEALDGVLKKQ
ncbi:MAG: TIGR03545 family protein [bacterium]|nr:TIGR03545 family protein [bacterium]